MTWFRVILWIGTFVYWTALFVVTHLPPDELHPPGGFNDKQLHFMAYMGLGVAMGLALMLSLPGRRWIPLFVIALGMAYGAIDERTQLFVGRACELGDWLADVAGVSAAAVLVFALQLIFRERAVPVGRQLIAGFEGIVPASAAGDAR